VNWKSTLFLVTGEYAESITMKFQVYGVSAITDVMKELAEGEVALDIMLKVTEPVSL